MEIKKGKIKDLQGSWGSGMAILVVETDEGRESLPCDNGPTVRALDSCFGVIEPGHTFNIKNAVDKEIFYSMDELGLLLAGFTPVEDAPIELVEAYESQSQED